MVELRFGSRLETFGRYQLAIDPTCFSSTKACRSTAVEATFGMQKTLGRVNPFLAVRYRGTTVNESQRLEEVTRQSELSSVRATSLDLGVQWLVF